MRVVFNPAPMTGAALDYPLDCVDVFVLNETEAEGLTGETSPEDVRDAMRERFPRAATVLTMGSGGAAFPDAETECRQAAIAVDAVDAVDTTAAATPSSATSSPSSCGAATRPGPSPSAVAPRRSA